MDRDPYDDRVTRLERSLLDHGGSRVGLDPVGEPDLGALAAEMRRLGFELVACDPHGYGYEAKFRRPAHDGHHAIHGTATGWSQRNAIFEAAIAALDGQGLSDASTPRLRGVSPQPVARWWRRIAPTA